MPLPLRAAHTGVVKAEASVLALGAALLGIAVGAHPPFVTNTLGVGVIHIHKVASSVQFTLLGASLNLAPQSLPAVLTLTEAIHTLPVVHAGLRDAWDATGALPYITHFTPPDLLTEALVVAGAETFHAHAEAVPSTAHSIQLGAVVHLACNAEGPL